MKVLQINYINQMVAVELVMYWDLCKGVSRVVGSVDHWLLSIGIHVLNGMITATIQV